MEDIKEQITQIIEENTGSKDIQLEVPPNDKMGDFALPCFQFAKEMKKSPQQIAEELKNNISDSLPEGISAKNFGPYLNFFIDSNLIASNIIDKIQKERECYGTKPENKRIVLVESPGPNTNKPLHLGHLRNMLLGKSIFNLIKAQGKDVHMVNIVNDRGIHICKSMLAYRMFGKEKTPETEGMKSDHFVGNYYVKYSEEEKNDKLMEQKANEVLVDWEKGDPETIKLWKTMNNWALEGFKQTYARLNFEIEKEYYESKTYEGGKDIILDALDKGIFEKDDDGAIICDLEDKGLGKKVMLRSNGTSLYITQDINTANIRYDDYKFDEMIYIVGNEQDYHFKVLFEVFKRLGWSFADSCYHFSYGMVELPDGKMKSRQGNVVDTDDLLDKMKELAITEVKSRYPDISNDDADKRADAISKAAIIFFFLKFDPLRNFVFNPKESLSFEGDTGPYVQYSHARICSIFRKYAENTEKEDIADADITLLDTELDKKMLKLLATYPSIIEDAAKQMKPSSLCHYLVDVASTFNEYYHKNPVLKEKEDVMLARLKLCDCVRIVLKSGLEMLGIKAIDRM